MRAFAVCMLTLLTTKPAFAQDDPKTEQQAKEREIDLPVVSSTIDWSAAKTDGAGSKIRSSGRFEALTTQLDTVKLPVLAPAVASLLSGATLVTGSGWYALEMSGADQHLTVYGNANTVSVPRLARELGAMTSATPFRSNYTDGVTTLSFVRYGVAYDLEIECVTAPGGATAPSAAAASRRTDPLVAGSPCLTDAQATDLYNRLEMLGGTP